MKIKFLCPRFFVKILLLCAVLFFVKTETSFGGNASVWGINTIVLKPITNGALSEADFLTNNCAVSLKPFYRAGGINLPATSTECRVTYDRQNLLVIFRCTENDMAFPTIRRSTNWFSFLGSPAEQDSEFPDKVDLFIQPNMGSRSYYQFAVTLDGLKFGCKRKDKSSETGEDTSGSVSFDKIKNFEATVVKGNNEWTVFLRIPWKTLGGKPKSYFGLLPIRTRWRDGEVSSPVAFDFAERPPIDLFIETHFSGETSVQAFQTNLYQLPSGTLRWQRPAWLSYPNTETLGQIWKMQQSLASPTDVNNFARRLYLTQCWMDLLTLEGFNFRTGTGSIVEENMIPSMIRRKVNEALEEKETLKAYKLLDTYLLKLDKVSRDWFADNSPGDILKEEWTPISRLTGIDVKQNTIIMHGLAGDHAVDLHLSLPKTGGIRIYGDNEGYFKPSGLLPLRVLQSSNSCSVKTTDCKIVIDQNPFTISICDADGNVITRIASDGIAFRFNQKCKVIAVDFKNHLDTNEVIYGFGERYNRFNENGNVLTLWGMDDWTGNTVGLMNETYKPLPIFHSSKGYMIFDNSTYRLRADIGKTNLNQYRLTQQGTIFDYYFWIGSPEKSIQSYTALTGKPVLPPKWAFEPWIGRTGRGWNKPSQNPVAEEESVVKRFEKLDIPHSAIYAEGSSADSAALNQFMAARGIKVLSWYYPVISEAEQESLMPKLKPDELPLLNVGNKTASRELGYVDFTNPNALELCRRWWQHRLEIGVAGSMVDFGDRVPEDAVFYNGKRGDEMHNFYSYDYQRTYSEVFREKRGDNFILFGRAAAPGTQKFVAQFAGDHPANFAGLQAVLTGALNLCACGFSIWGSDLGGFLGWPEPAVYMRWTQFACFSPLMRCHGRTPREPWNYGAAAVANYKYFAWVRENLLDYIYDSAIHSHKTGIPIMRSMVIAYPDDSALAAVKDEYMFGRDLLVAPVIAEDNIKAILFPSGKWTGLWNGEIVNGPTNFTVCVRLNAIPVYLKQGAAIRVKLNQELKLGQSMTDKNVNAMIVTPPKNEEEVSLINEQGCNATVTLRPETNGFVMKLKNLPETGYLLIYGAKVVAVKMDGEVVPEFAGKEFISMPTGWEIDPTINRAVICLPSDQASKSSLSREIKVELQPKDK